VLVVEDEWLIADLLQAMLTELGYEVIGPAFSVAQALKLIQEQAPDAALLDVSLDEAKSFAVADAMASRGAPFLFLTGYVNANLPARYRTSRILSKPVSITDLRAPLAGMARPGRASDGAATGG
jgi:CheY-like chemotaxis protein